MAKKTSTKKKGATTAKKKVTIKKLAPKKVPKIDPKNTSKNTLKNDVKIEETIIEKEDNNTLENEIPREEVPINDSKNPTENDVLKMLKIPAMDSVEKAEENRVEKQPEPEFETLNDPDEPFFADEDPLASDKQKENIKDGMEEPSEFEDYEDMGSGDGDFMFSDHALMAEMGVEIIDLLMTTGAMAIAKDFGNEEKYSVSDYRKSKLKKPLAMLLEKKGKTLPPEVMFVMVVIGVYAPVVFSAVQERQRKNKQAQAEAEQKQQAQVIKKKGRPKGSKDSKPRKPKTITIKQNKNESD